MTKEQVAQLIYKSLPYSNQITDLKLPDNEYVVRFEWRGAKYRVGLSSPFYVQEVGDDGVFIGGTRDGVLMGALLRVNAYKMMQDEARKDN